MSAPFPILPTPTPDARERFMRAAHAAGFKWGHGPFEDQVRHARGPARYTHVYLYNESYPLSYCFVENPVQTNDLMSKGTLVNSPAHYIAYVKRHFPSKS